MSREWSHAERALELPAVLKLIAERCATVLGNEKALFLEPTYDFDLIQIRIQQAKEALDIYCSNDLPEIGSARDVRTQVASAGKGMTLPGSDLFRVSETLGAMIRLSRFLKKFKASAPALSRFCEQIPELDNLQRELNESVNFDGDVLDTASAELKKIRTEKNTHQKRLSQKIQNLISGAYRTYLQEPLYTIRDGRYVIPVKSAYRGKVPGIVHDASASGQTLFIEPEAIVGEGNRLRELEAHEREEVEKVLKNLSEKVGADSQNILSGLEALTEVDIIFAKAKYAFDRKSCYPSIKQGGFLVIKGGHHPLIDEEISVPISISIGGGYGSLLITGPNTGGKTVTLKILGLYCLMMGCGIFPPAEEVTYGAFRSVHADIGDEQSLQQSLSTFSSHLKNIARIFKEAEEGSLVLLDEIGAGTDPREGAALAKAMIEKFLLSGVTVAASTHYGELKTYAQNREGIHCAAMEFDMQTLAPTYRLIPGASGASHALEISQRYGIPADVVNKAEEFAGQEWQAERESAQVLDDVIKEKQKELEKILQMKNDIEAEKKELERETKKYHEGLKKIREDMNDKIQNALRETREQYRELLERVKHISSTDDKEKLIADAKKIESSLLEIKTLLPEENQPEPKKQELKVGMRVQIKGHGQPGTIIELLDGGKVRVLVGALKMVVSENDIFTLSEQPEKPKISKASFPRKNKMDVPSEIHIRHMRAEDAEIVVTKFLDDASLAGMHRVRIVHGKGQGILRKIVHNILKARDDVKDFRLADTSEGGDGATVVYFS